MADQRPVFKDKRVTVHHFAHDVLVRCPKCGRCARVFTLDDAGALAAQRWRMSCVECGYHQERTGPCCRSLDSGANGPVGDPIFGIEVWLQASCCGGKRLWAYNAEHLDYLESFVAATIRQRPDPVAASVWNRRMTLIAKLPAWLKSAKNRDEILRSIARLRTTLR